MTDWRLDTVTWQRLVSAANRSSDTGSIVLWLKTIGVIPPGENITRGNRIPNVNLDPKAIKCGYLAEVAKDWDDLGPSTPKEFIWMLSYEVSGTPEHTMNQQLLDGRFEYA